MFVMNSFHFSVLVRTVVSECGVVGSSFDQGPTTNYSSSSSSASNWVRPADLAVLTPTATDIRNHAVTTPTQPVPSFRHGDTSRLSTTDTARSKSSCVNVAFGEGSGRCYAVDLTPHASASAPMQRRALRSVTLDSVSSTTNASPRNFSGNASTPPSITCRSAQLARPPSSLFYYRDNHKLSAKNMTAKDDMFHHELLQDEVGMSTTITPPSVDHHTREDNSSNNQHISTDDVNCKINFDRKTNNTYLALPTAVRQRSLQMETSLTDVAVVENANVDKYDEIRYHPYLPLEVDNVNPVSIETPYSSTIAPANPAISNEQDIRECYNMPRRNLSNDRSAVGPVVRPYFNFSPKSDFSSASDNLTTSSEQTSDICGKGGLTEFQRRVHDVEQQYYRGFEYIEPIGKTCESRESLQPRADHRRTDLPMSTAQLPSLAPKPLNYCSLHDINSNICGANKSSDADHHAKLVQLPHCGVRECHAFVRMDSTPNSTSSDSLAISFDRHGGSAAPVVIPYEGQPWARDVYPVSGLSPSARISKFCEPSRVTSAAAVTASLSVDSPSSSTAVCLAASPSKQSMHPNQSLASGNGGRIPTNMRLFDNRSPAAKNRSLAIVAKLERGSAGSAGRAAMMGGHTPTRHTAASAASVKRHERRLSLGGGGRQNTSQAQARQAFGHGSQYPRSGRLYPFSHAHHLNNYRRHIRTNYENRYPHSLLHYPAHCRTSRVSSLLASRQPSVPLLTGSLVGSVGVVWDLNILQVGLSKTK